MTGLQLAAALETAGISQTDLAGRLSVTARAVRMWVADGVPARRLAAVGEAIAQRPRVFLSRGERARVAQLLEGVADTRRGQDARDAAVLAARIRAGVGGVLTRESG